MKGLWGSAILIVMATAAHAEILDPPDKPLIKKTTDLNDGYTFGRGVIFMADADLTITDVGWHNTMAADTELTFFIYEITKTTGHVLDGTETLLSTATMSTIENGLAAHATSIEPTSLQAGSTYLLQVKHDVLGLENWYYDFDPDQFEDPPFTVGQVTVIDGTAAGNANNFVLPRMQFNELGCAADINGDGVLDVLDFVAFQNAWQAQDPIADCDASGTWDILDFVCYQNLFQQGCD